MTITRGKVNGVRGQHGKELKTGKMIADPTTEETRSKLSRAGIRMKARARHGIGRTNTSTAGVNVLGHLGGRRDGRRR